MPGGRLGFRHYEAPDAPIALVLIHGSGCFGDLFHKMADQIASRRAAHVFTLNMRGHGFSAGRPGHAIAGAAEATQDILAFLRLVRRRARGCRVILGGHSAGAGLVLRAIQAECGADGYVFLAPCLGLAAPPNRRQFGGWVRPRLLTLAAVVAANLAGVRSLNGRTVVDFSREPANDERYVAGWSFDTLDAFTPAWGWRRLRIPAHAPVVVLALQDDECFDTSRYRAALRQLAPQARLPRLGRGGHWDLLADDRAIDALCEWLAERALLAPTRRRARRRRGQGALVTA